jgi:hypothetical protein
MKLLSFVKNRVMAGFIVLLLTAGFTFPVKVMFYIS